MSQTLVARVEGRTLPRLREAARHLFVSRGYHETRPQDIARRAGVANGSFYLHFADKQAAFLDFAEQAQNELIDLFRERLQDLTGSRDRWWTVCAALLDFGESHRGVLQAAFIDPVFIAPNNDDAWRMYERLGQLVEAAVLEVEADYDNQLISHGLCGFLRHAMIYASRREMDKEQLLDNISLFIDRGLSSQGGTR